MQPGSREDWAAEAKAFGRAFGGAFLFATPLLYTMEMWWIGEFADLWKLVVFLGLAFLASLGLVYLTGFQHRSRSGASRVLDQALYSLAAGVTGSVIVLLVLNRIQPGDPLDSVVGKVVVQAVPLSVGASLAGAIFRPGADRQRSGEEQPEFHGWEVTLNDLGATMIGGTLLGFTIAPTDEIPMLAAELSVSHVLALIGLSLLLGYVIVFVSGFDPQAIPATHPGPLQHPLAETGVTYLLSLLVATVSLYLFDQIAFSDPPLSIVNQVLILGLPTTVGGAAGRLAI